MKIMTVPRVAIVHAVLLLGAVAALLVSAPPAFAQLNRLVVTVTAPANGATVSGTTAVAASVEIVGAVTVRGVQFTVDGVNIGAEDTESPYSIPWNTLTASNGSHTLRAVARDVLGQRWTSDPVTVTVFNDLTPPAVSLTAPAAGSTVSGVVSVNADASDNVGVSGVQFRLDGANIGAEDTTAPYSIPWDTVSVADGPHTLSAIARDAAGHTSTSASVVVSVVNAVRFKPGDVFVSLEPGPVQWWRPDGTKHGDLLSTVGGVAEGMEFDAGGNLLVARWRSADLSGGNTVEKFSVFGQSLGPVGSGYDCDPHALDFDRAGVAYVGQAGCERSVLRFAPGESTPTRLHPAVENMGIFWLDLAADDCTLFYTSVGPNVKRFNVCTGVQLPDFNTTALPGSFTHDLRVLPDGGVLVANDTVITRLDASGAVVRTYQGPPESTLWAGLDLAGDGTFWVVNYYTSNIYRFDLATGQVVGSFNTGTSPNTAVDVLVVKEVR